MLSTHYIASFSLPYNANNLQLYRVKSLEIVFERPKSNRKQTIPPPVVPGICRVEHVKVLGVTISRKFSVSSHVDELLAKCSQSLFALSVCAANSTTTRASASIPGCCY